ncbi:proclotting enzyme-like isoform X2 [Diachasmimorpha longicaudata]|uniref:proclotting enzyme-like isoform X2 n=1 Tax=Diachasmimorpha longicaudata TaxID=58733 RepID=UPI0030B88F41
MQFTLRMSSWVLGIFVASLSTLGAWSYEEYPQYLHPRYGVRPQQSHYPLTRRWSDSWNDGPPRSPLYRRDTQDPSKMQYTRLVRQSEPRSDPLMTISETLGALNTVGSYIVNMTRGVDSESPPKELPSAIYTISKNILGRNVTDSIAPLVRGVTLPLRPSATSAAAPEAQSTTTVETVINRDKEAASSTCTTSEGTPGKCQDLSNCPQLLLDLTKLRQSLCFKSLFVPGVCCPVDKGDGSNVSPGTGSSVSESGRPPRPQRPAKPVTPRPIPLYPIATSTVSTVLKPLPVGNGSNGLDGVDSIENNFIQDDEECGVRNAGKFRVVGGEEALPGRWPWMAAIFLRGTRKTEFWCGGSLIGPRHILTAAHCTRDMRQRPFAARQFTVRLGDIDLERDDEPSSPETYEVRAVHAHNKFSRVGYYNDIAILELSRSVRKTPYVRPICLPQGRYLSEVFAGTRPTVVGWGTTYYGGKESTVQRQAVLPVWRNEDCNAAYFQPITGNFLCAGYSQGGKDACQGDSGGPLMLRAEGKWMQIGIVSFGNKCGEPGYPGVYTRVTSYADWIKTNVN